MNIRTFIKKYNVRVASCTAVNENPNNRGWRDANHYKVTLRCRNRQMTLFFSQGYGIDHEPDPYSIFCCLVSDTWSVRNTPSFEEWARDLGYDPDSRTAEKTFKACEKQAEKVEKFFGDLFDEFLQCQDEG